MACGRNGKLEYPTQADREVSHENNRLREFRKQSPESSHNLTHQPPSVPEARSSSASFSYPAPPPHYSYHERSCFVDGQGGPSPQPLSSSHYDANGSVPLLPPICGGVIPMMPYPYPYPPHPGYPQYHWAPVAPPLEYISDIQPSDVLSGRGGATNSHSGNRAFRSLVKQFQDNYLKAKKRDKPAVASLIVQKVRDKGGRFLKRVDTTPEGQVLWIDIGDERAKEKACQALREGAPEIRRKCKAASTDEDDEKKSGDDSGNLSANSAGIDPSNAKDNSSRFSTYQSHMMRNAGAGSYAWQHCVQPAAAAPIMIRPSAVLIKRRIPEAISVDHLEPHDRELYLRDFLPPDPRIRKVVGITHDMRPSNSLSEVSSTRHGKMNSLSVVNV